MEEIVALRNKLNIKRPNFYKQSTHKKSRLAKKWRKPRGSDSKLAIERKGIYPGRVKAGYRGPVAARGLNKDGKRTVLVHCLGDFNKLKKGELAIIASVGIKKKIELVKYCIEKGLQIANLKNPSEFLDKVAAKRKELKEEQKKRALEKNKAEKSTKEKPKEDIESKIDKEAEKQEKDKVLTKRDL
jgi:large subunit ribosomal protein L32e